ncbi:MAG: ChpI protein [Armatimonadetes bacterium]|nr:ChpI protein [Armatimonadota bacterium]
MKTAISIPDELFRSAEEYAEREGLSRSELYTTALRLFLEAHRREAVTERLNAIYGEEPSALDPALARLQARSLPDESWE